MVVWGDGDDWRQFLAVASAARAGRLYLQPESYSREAMEGSAAWLAQRIGEAIEPWDRYEGESCAATAAWYRDSVGHYFNLRCDWSSECMRAGLTAVGNAKAVAQQSRVLRS